MFLKRIKAKKKGGANNINSREIVKNDDTIIDSAILNCE